MNKMTKKKTVNKQIRMNNKIDPLDPMYFNGYSKGFDELKPFLKKSK